MNFRTFIGSSIVLAVTSVQVQALGLGDLLGGSSAQQPATADSSATAGTTASANAGLTDILAGQLSSKLGISQTQAAAGLGLLVSYAGNALPDTYASQLKALLPTASSSGGSGLLGGLGSQLTGNVQSMADVNKGFETLGMDSSMVGSFTPLLESAVANTGATDLATALGALW